MDSDPSTGEIHQSISEPAVNPVHLDLPKTRLRIERTASKFDSNANTSESHRIDFVA